MSVTISDKDFEITQKALALANSRAATSGNNSLSSRSDVTEATHEALGRLATACPACPPPSPPPVKNPTS